MGLPALVLVGLIDFATAGDVEIGPAFGDAQFRADGWVEDVAFNADGSLVVLDSSGSVHWFSVPEGSRLRSVRLPCRVWRAVLSDGGRRAAMRCEDGSERVADLSDGASLVEIPPTTAWLQELGGGGSPYRKDLELVAHPTAAWHLVRDPPRLTNGSATIPMPGLAFGGLPIADGWLELDPGVRAWNLDGGLRWERELRAHAAAANGTDVLVVVEASLLRLDGSTGETIEEVALSPPDPSGGRWKVVGGGDAPVLWSPGGTRDGTIHVLDPAGPIEVAAPGGVEPAASGSWVASASGSVAWVHRAGGAPVVVAEPRAVQRVHVSEDGRVAVAEDISRRVLVSEGPGWRLLGVADRVVLEPRGAWVALLRLGEPAQLTFVRPDGTVLGEVSLTRAGHGHEQVWSYRDGGVVVGHFAQAVLARPDGSVRADDRPAGQEDRAPSTAIAGAVAWRLGNGLSGARDRKIELFDRETGEVLDVRLFSGGRVLAAGLVDGVPALFRAEGPAGRAEKDEHWIEGPGGVRVPVAIPAGNRLLAMDPDARWCAVARGLEITWLSTATSAELERTLLESGVSSLAVSADGTVAWAVLSDGRIQRLDLPDWDLPPPFVPEALSAFRLTRAPGPGGGRPRSRGPRLPPADGERWHSVERGVTAALVTDADGYESLRLERAGAEPIDDVARYHVAPDGDHVLVLRGAERAFAIARLSGAEPSLQAPAGTHPLAWLGPWLLVHDPGGYRLVADGVEHAVERQPLAADAERVVLAGASGGDTGGEALTLRWLDGRPDVALAARRAHRAWLAGDRVLTYQVNRLVAYRPDGRVAWVRALGPTVAFALSPDARRFAVGDRIVSVRTGRVVGRLATDGWVSDLDWTRDGGLLGVHADGAALERFR